MYTKNKDQETGYDIRFFKIIILKKYIPCLFALIIIKKTKPKRFSEKSMMTSVFWIWYFSKQIPIVHTVFNFNPESSKEK